MRTGISEEEAPKVEQNIEIFPAQKAKLIAATIDCIKRKEVKLTEAMLIEQNPH